MVKRATVWEISLGAVLLVIGCAYGFALAKEKLVLKYLPVDHDIEIISQDNTSNPIHLYETRDPAIADIIKKVNTCTDCRTLDMANASQCPDCCLYQNYTLVHCQDSSDTSCPKQGTNPNQRPFDTSCIDCTNTFTRDCGSCPEPCAKYPETITHCQRRGCPESTRPNHASCKPDPLNPSNWYCQTPNIPPVKPCSSSMIQNCTAYTSPNAAYTITPEFNIAVCQPLSMTAPCYRYAPIPPFQACVQDCVQQADHWEDVYYQYNRGMLGDGVCGEYGNCTSGFTDNCNAGKCQEKINLKCFSDYTIAQCAVYEKKQREYLLGIDSKVFREISPEFKYKFVARNGERYMAGWQVLCDVVKPAKDDPDKEKFNFYTMIKLFKVDNAGAETLAYESIAHQKSLGSTFYINAQTGFSQVEQKLIPGQQYVARLYYYLPWDGATLLEVKVSVLQMILYRTKN